MAKGGYMIIDLTQYGDITGTPKTAKGLYKKLDSNFANGKPVLLKVASILGAKYPPRYTEYKLEAGNYVIFVTMRGSLGGYLQIRVSSNDDLASQLAGAS